MSVKQWKSKKLCVNCGHKNEMETTPYFSGMVSLMMPTASWVAKYRGLQELKPGIYALKLLDDESEENDYQEDKQTRKKRQTTYGAEPDVYSDDAEGYYDEK